MKILLSLSTLFLSVVLNAQPTNFFLKYNFNSNFNDESVNSIDATSFSANYVGSYQSGSLTAASFNGSTAYGSISSSNTIKRPFPISIGFWINFSNDGEQKTVFKSDVNNSNDYGYWIKISTNNSIEVGFGDGGISGITSKKIKTSSTVLTENTWQHVVCIFKSTAEMEIFIDCQNAGGSYSGSGASTIQYNSYSSQFARDYVSGTSTLIYSSFKIDEFTMYSRELTSNEINLFCDPSSSINEYQKQKIDVYPNPATNAFYVDLYFSEKFNLTVKDLNGKQLITANNISSNQLISLENLPSGVYLIFLQTDGGNILTDRLIIDN
jgi:hypothetical protein